MTHGVPIIRLEIERMRQTVLTALSGYTAAIDAEVEEAVERYCRPENLRVVIQEAVEREMNAAVKEEVRNFFREARPGRQLVRLAVNKHLDRLDEAYGDGQVY